MNRRAVAISLGAVAVVVLSLPTARHLTSMGSTGPVYTVAQVVAGLVHQPRAWAGRTVTVRGMVAALAYGTPASNGNELCAARCTMNVPRGVQAHLYLVEETRTATTAYVQLVSAAQ